MPKATFYPRFVVLSVVVAALLALYAWSSCYPEHNQVYAGNESPSVALTWQESVPQVKHFSFSSSNDSFYIIRSNETASVYSSSGVKRCNVELNHASRMAVSPGGKYAMAYSHLNPVDSTLTFFDSQGKKIWDMEVDGAVWSAGAYASGDDTRFVVGTGDKYVYIVDVSAGSKHYRRWRAPGVVVSLSVDPRGKHVTLGTWQNSSVTRCTLAGKKLWTVNAEASQLQYVERTHTPDRMLVRSVPNKSGIDGTFNLLDDRGKRIWSGKIKSNEKTRVLYSPNGRYVCLGYEKIISHKGETTSEKHAALFDGNGRRLWDKGSLFFHPLPLAVTSGGCVVISSDKNAVFTMNRDGELNPSIKLPGSVVKSVVSPDGSRVLLECSNGKLCLLRISG